MIPSSLAHCQLHRWLLLFLFIFSYSSAANVVVEFSGVEGATLDNLKAGVRLAQPANQKDLSPARLRLLHKEAPQDIRARLEPLGYYHAQIASELIAPAAEEGEWHARYNITLGAPMRYRNLHTTLTGPGEQEAKLTRWLANFPLHSGAALNHPAYDQAKREFITLAKSLGYLDIKFPRAQLRLDEAANQADVDWEIDTGPRYQFGAVTFTGTPFAESFLQRFAPPAHAPYTAEALADLRRKLYLSGYFSTVEIEEQRAMDATGARVHLTVRLGPLPRNQYKALLGYGTDSGVRLSLAWEQRYLNSVGHRWKSGARVQEKKRKLEVDSTYEVPTGSHRLDYFSASLALEQQTMALEDLEDDTLNLLLADADGSTLARQFQLTLRKNHPRSLWGDVQAEESWLLRLVNEQYDLLGVMPADFQRWLQQQHPEMAEVLKVNYQMIIPGIRWHVLQTDDRTYSLRGWELKWILQGAWQALGSNQDFWQTQLSGRWIRGITQHDRILLRGEIGYTVADTVPGSDFLQLPQGFQFRTGGDRSVRGYGFEKLDGSGLGAGHLFTASVEWEHQFLPKWSGVVFWDTGNVFNAWQSPDLQHGAGVGLRWQSPIGMVRLDVAVAVSSDDDPVRIHLSVGPDF